MIPSLLGTITGREVRRFLRLQPGIDEAVICPTQPDGGNTSLYVHVAFCRYLCPFCPFDRERFREDRARRYYQDLREELNFYVQRGFTFNSVYVGGGTPTVLMDELVPLLDILRTGLGIKHVSVETNPRDLTEANIARLKDAGVNRLSVGIQSFDPAVLKAMGRSNGPLDWVKGQLQVAQGQFDTLNLDFIFNFPGQTIGQLQADIAAFEELDIDQATFYPLMPSPHKREALAHRFDQVDTTREKQYFNVVLRHLLRDGYTPSTPWCYSRGDRMLEEYLTEYENYVGVGASSISLLGSNWYVNTFSVDHYHELVSAKRFPVIGSRTLTRRQSARYYLLTRLFGLKLDAGEYRRYFGGDIWQTLRLELAFLKALGVVSGRNLLRLTAKGMYPLSAMMSKFLIELNTFREYCIENQI